MWSIAKDGRWYSPEELADQLGLRKREVESVLDFLVKHGFVELRIGSVAKVRINRLAPSPHEAVRILRAVHLEPKQLREFPRNKLKEKSL